MEVGNLAIEGLRTTAMASRWTRNARERIVSLTGASAASCPYVSLSMSAMCSISVCVCVCVSECAYSPVK